MSEKLAFEATLPEPHGLAIEQVTEELAAEGFGILTRTDVRQTLKQKLGVDIPPLTILGACNPRLAHQALGARPDTALLLPCTVTVEERPEGGSLVRIGNPMAFLALGDFAENTELLWVAEEASRRLERVSDRLALEALPVS